MDIPDLLRFFFLFLIERARLDSELANYLSEASLVVSPELSESVRTLGSVWTPRYD